MPWSRPTATAGFHVNVAVGYGGRQEIVDAVRALLGKELANGATGEQLIEAVTADAISENLYTSGQPDPDLVIRTSGEQRLSGFLLWQSAYSEMWFTEAYWPEFRRVDFLRALRDYTARHRRYGGHLLFARALIEAASALRASAHRMPHLSHGCAVGGGLLAQLVVGPVPAGP